jgi:hypothetical protein
MPSYMKTTSLISFLFLMLLMISNLDSKATEPIVTVRFANPQYTCANQTYNLDVEFQCNMPGKELFGMNVRFFYPEDLLEFLAFNEFTAGYGVTAPDPPLFSTGDSSSGMTYFGFPGPQEYINGAIQKISGETNTYISTTGWTKLFAVNFHVDDTSSMNSDSFCPSVIWDLNEAADGGINPQGGIIITMVLTYPNITEPATEHCAQFNWQYDGVPGLPHGYPVSTNCINTICSYAPHSILKVFGVLNPGSINVPVVVTNFNNMSGLNLVFEYDPAVMTYINQTPNAIFNSTNGYLTVTDMNSTGGKKKITLHYLGNTISLADSAHISDLHFSYLSGTSNLTWKTDGTSCEYRDSNHIPAYDLPYSSYYFNGAAVTLQAPVIKIDTTTADPGDLVTFAIKVWNYLNIHSGQLTLNYNPSILTYYTSVPNAAIASNFNAVVNTAGTLLLSWVGTDTTLAGGSSLIYATFNYPGGSCPLTWYNSGSSCQYVNSGQQWILNDTPTENFYKNGSISNATLVWTGLSSGDWSNAANWNQNVVPNQLKDVVIDPSTNPQYWPIYSGNLTLGQNCNNLTLNNNAKLTITGNLTNNPGHTLKLTGSGTMEVYHDWVNSGTFIPGSGTIKFLGSENAHIAQGVPPANYIGNYLLSTFSAGMVALSGGTSGPSGDNAHLDASIGFGFNYLRVNYSQARINTNGWLSLNLSGADTSSPDNTLLFESGAPTTVLAPWWDDLRTDGSTTIKYQTQGTSPNRIFTVEWKNILSYSTAATSRLNFQVKLYESSNIIEFHYGNAVSGSHNGNESASIGVKDGTGGTGNFIEATYNSTTNVVACLKSNLNWPGLNYRFTPPATNQMEQFYKMLVSKSGGNLFIQRDVKITGIE